MTWKTSGIRHDDTHDQIRLSKDSPHKDGRDFILCEYEAPPEVELESVQQVRAVWKSGKQQWELHVVCKYDITTESPGENVTGVDLGICNPAAVAFPNDSLFYPGNRLREDKHYSQREEYQTEGNHGPSHKAQWAREKLSRRKDHFLHVLSKDIVERCVEHDVGTLVVGDPSGVDESDWGRHGNKCLDNWAHKRVMNLIDHKARERGIEVEMPDSRIPTARHPYECRETRIIPPRGIPPRSRGRKSIAFSTGFSKPASTPHIRLCLSYNSHERRN